VLADRPRLRAVLSWTIPAGVFLVVILAVFWRLWTGIDGAPRAFAWDAQWEYWGDLQFLHDAVRDGQLPLWNPFDRAGYPLHADPQAGVLYPVNWLLVALSFVTGTKWWLVAIKIIAHFWLAGFGMYTFLRWRKLPQAACYAGGVFFMLCYPFSHAMFSALNWGMAWLPWMLLAVEAWAQRPSLGRGAGVALAFGLAELAGAPAAFWYSLLVVVPYGVWAIVHHARARGDARAYLHEAAYSTALAGALFVAIVAAQFLATSQLVTHTVRDARNLDFIGTSVFNAEELMAFAIPRMPVPNEGPYLTIVMLFSIAAVLSVEPTPRRLVLAGVAVAGVLCAFGNQGGFLPAAASMVPPFGFFRRAHRYFYVCVAPLAILGAEGLALLARTSAADLQRKYGRALLIGGALGVLVFGIGFTIHAQKGKAAEDIREAFGFAAVSFVVSTWVLYMLVTRVELRGKQVFLAIAAVLLGLDLWFARFLVTEKNFVAVPVPTRDRDAQTLAGVPLEARVYDRELFKFRPGIRLGIRDLGGYEGDPLALSRFAGLLKMVQAQPSALGHANVRWLLEEKTTPTKPAVLPKGGLTPGGKPGVFEVPAVAPAVEWIDAARLIQGGPDKVFAELKSATPGQVGLLEAGTLARADEVAGLYEGTAAPVAGKITRYDRSRLTADIVAPDTGLVVIHEAYYPGWTARVDGKEVHVLPANGLFRGVVVGAGHHTIEMEYKATQYRVLAPVSVLGLLAAAGLFFVDERRRRRAQAARA
jgi:hypothetical protein